MVAAGTREQAQAAAALIEVTYDRDKPVLAFDDPRASSVSHPWTPDYVRGDVTRSLAAADVRRTAHSHRTCLDIVNRHVGRAD
jgi:CO/xanthine dehydrogenase Mo-binding subunit